jgi:hypothetical protein
MSSSLKTTARRLLVASKALAPPPAEPNPCPHCGVAGLVDPGDDEHLTLLAMTAEELRALRDGLGYGPCPPGGWKARLMWCPGCERLVPAGRYRREWDLKYLGGCTKEEAGPEMWRNYTDRRLVHDVYIFRATGRWPDDDAEAPAGPEPAPAASSYQDVLVEDAGPPRFGGSEP